MHSSSSAKADETLLPPPAMIATVLITLRETLETSLLIGVMLAYLRFTDRRSQEKFVWLGVATGIAASFLGALAIHLLSITLEGRVEKIYEGIMMLVAAGLLSSMIIWMMHCGRRMKSAIESEVEVHVRNDHVLGIFLLSFISTAREGLETVIFLHAAVTHAQGTHIAGALLGLSVALLIAWLAFRGFRWISLRTFFSVTSILLLLFAAGLVAHGIHELVEAGLPGIIYPLWTISPTFIQGLETTTAGAFIVQLAKTFFGFHPSASLLETLAYVGYCIGIGSYYVRLKKKRTQ